MSDSLPDRLILVTEYEALRRWALDNGWGLITRPQGTAHLRASFVPDGSKKKWKGAPQV